MRVRAAAVAKLCDAVRRRAAAACEHVEMVKVVGEEGLLRHLHGESQAATGNLSVAQAGNQLVALSVEQQMQMQQLMAAQYRMVALEESRRAATREQARIRHKRFVGDGVAYARD